MNDRTEQAVAIALAEAMRDSVADVEAEPPFLTRVRVRAARRSRGRWIPVLATTAAVLVVIVGTSVVGGRAGDTPTKPAAPIASSDEHPRFAPTELPPGFDSTPYNETSRYRPESRVWAVELRYGRRPPGSDQTPTGVLLVETLSGDVDARTLEQHRERYPQAKEVRVGDRTVIHLYNDEARGALNAYEWNEPDGVVVSVTGIGDVTDAELRAFLSALRRAKA